jgi:hypothetical protein
VRFDRDGRRDGGALLAARFDDHDCRIDHVEGEHPADRRAHRVGTDRSLRQQQLNQRFGAVPVAAVAAGSIPELLMRGRERARSSGPHERRRRQQRAGLVGEDLEVMIEIEDLFTFAASPMGRHDRSAVEHLDRFRAHAHVETPSRVTGWDRVMALPDTHPRFGVNAMRTQDHHVERFVGQPGKRRRLETEMLTDADAAMRDESPVVEEHRRGDQIVELRHRTNAGNGDEMTAPEPSDLSLDTSFLMRAADAGDAEETVEPVMRPQRNEPLRLEPVTAPQHLHHRGFQVVVTDPAGHTTKVFERTDVAIQEHFLCLVQIRPTEPAARRGEPHHEQGDLAQHAVEIDADRPEIDFGFRTQPMRLRDLHLSQRQRPLGADLCDVTPHR